MAKKSDLLSYSGFSNDSFSLKSLFFRTKVATEYFKDIIKATEIFYKELLALYIIFLNAQLNA